MASNHLSREGGVLHTTSLHQVARRQRCAIACCYCRKRKIRCSGQRRCDNCVRLNQPCEFIPMSSTAQTFVRIRGVNLDVSTGQISGHPVMSSNAHGRLWHSQHPASEGETFPPPLQAKQDCYDQPSGSMSQNNAALWEYPEPINLAPVLPEPV
ncbi:hypothetical protein BJX66DRAFT_112317 [Aspergillus keveii]|uniref:Zn(2)-C6 fungal-type domain-containing protein n=1 Tax=Aspergillus keveii TaxID=714993 RepID=A0ABR4FKR7_9EURO